MLAEALCGLSKNCKTVICMWHSSVHHNNRVWDQPGQIN